MGAVVGSSSSDPESSSTVGIEDGFTVGVDKDGDRDDCRTDGAADGKADVGTAEDSLLGAVVGFNVTVGFAVVSAEGCDVIILDGAVVLASVASAEGFIVGLKELKLDGDVVIMLLGFLVDSVDGDNED